MDNNELKKALIKASKGMSKELMNGKYSVKNQCQTDEFWDEMATDAERDEAYADYMNSKGKPPKLKLVK